MLPWSKIFITPPVLKIPNLSKTTLLAQYERKFCTRFLVISLAICNGFFFLQWRKYSTVAS